MLGSLWGVEVLHHQQLHLLRNHHRVGIVVDIIRTVEIIALIAELVRQTFFLHLEVYHTELTFVLQVRIVGCSPYDAVLPLREVPSDGIKGVGLTQFDGVVDLGLLRILVWHDVVRHLSLEVTVVLQRVRSYLYTGFGIHHRQGDGGGAERIEHPLGEPALVVVYIFVVYPQTDRQRETHGRATHERTVGCIGQRCFHFSQGYTLRIRVLLVFHTYLLDAGIQHLILLQSTRRGASGHKHQCNQSDDISIYFPHPSFSSFSR